MADGGRREERSPPKMSFIVNIRFNSHRLLPVEVEPWWVVQRLKTELERIHCIPAEDFRIIFQGRELQDSLVIQDCDLSDYSVLHVVRGQKQSGKKSVSAHGHLRQLHLEAASGYNCSLNQMMDFKSSTGPNHHQHRSIPAIYRPQFYVYCKSPCAEIRPGKLRVRCVKCKQGTLTVDRDPCCWEDVLPAERITGACQADGCDGCVAEFYFKCAGHQSGEDEGAVPLDLIKSNSRDVPCIACMDIENPVVVFGCENGHSMCLDCFRLYCLTKLNDRAYIHHQDFGYTLPCPAGCPDSFIKEAHHFRILGNEQYDRYQRFGTEECVLQMGGVLCPGRGCGAGLLPEPGYRQVICVEGCGHMFCRTCLEPYHDGDCENQYAPNTEACNGYRVNPRNAERARWERDSKEIIRKTTKPCPNCKVPVEKDGGCMHMLCPRCGMEWCWQCSTQWNRDCQADHWFG